MSRSPMFLPVAPAWMVLLALAGCNPTMTSTPPASATPSPVRTARRPAPPSPPVAADAIPRDRQLKPRDTWDTARDRRFAEFLRDTAGSMIRQSTVGLERKGRIRVQLSKSVNPEDTLDLTKSVLAGARKDFPDKAITEWVYDPDGALILKAQYQPGQGVRYQLADGESGQAEPDATEPQGSVASEALAKGGVTARDRKFSAWAEEHGQPYLRYVESDLETHGRLWIGLTEAVEPTDVRELTASLLEGARKEFPRRALAATVFDPHGERIGTARMGRDGKVQWDK